MYGYIYKTTNLVNGKIYIGKHKSSSFQFGKYKGSGKILNDAFKKYGFNNFKCELLESINGVPTICESKEQLNKSEKYYIDFYNCVSDSSYYNIKEGGDGGDTVNNYIWINNGKVNLFILESDLEKYKDYKKGRIQKCEWYTNGKSSIYIDSSIELIPEGYYKGRVIPKLKGYKQTKEHIAKLSARRKGHTPILTEKQKIEKSNKLKKALKGKPKSKETRKKLSESALKRSHTSGYVNPRKLKKYNWYTNGQKNILILSGNPIPEGYYKGRVKNYNKI